MPFSNPIRPYGRPAEPQQIRGPEITLAVAAALVAVAMGFGALALPMPLILPVGSVLLLALACAIAVIGWRAPREQPNRVSYWDVSGALTLVGICAALLSEPEHVLPLLEGAAMEKK